jgi:hypothetical protein
MAKESYPKYPIGSYVIVGAEPGPWESSGEDEEDIAALVGHVGVVVEVSDMEDDEGVNDPMHLIRFPDRNDERTGQRNIESSCLGFICNPNQPLTAHIFES